MVLVKGLKVFSGCMGESVDESVVRSFWAIERVGNSSSTKKI